MKVLVLGSAAGGGFPQWNCNCFNSSQARKNPKKAKPRTQSSIAVSVDDGKNWFLFNASPDLRQQINDNMALQPKIGIRHSPILGAFITNGDIDQSDLIQNHSALGECVDRLEGVKGLSVCELTEEDILRNGIIRRILSRLK